MSSPVPRARLSLSHTHTQMHAKFARTEAAFSMSLETCVFYSNSPFVCFVCLSFLFFFWVLSQKCFWRWCKGRRMANFSLSVSVSLSLCDTVWDRICVASFFFSFLHDNFFGWSFFSLQSHSHLDSTMVSNSASVLQSH